MSRPAELLAKSMPRRGEGQGARAPLTLLEHSLDTEEAAAELFAPESRFARNFCRFFGIQDPAERARLVLNLRVAGLFHDIGKANEHFQRAVTRPGSPPQTVRHEHLSALVLCLQPVRAWLAGNLALDVDAITAAVLSHHLKAADRDHQHYIWCQPRQESVLALHLDHPQVAALLERVARVADLRPAPALPDQPWSDNAPWGAAIKQGRDEYARKFRRAVKRDRARRAFCLALKAGVIAADTVASAMVRTGQSIPDWIRAVAHKDRLEPAHLDEAIIGPRTCALSRGGEPFAFHEFQRRAATLGPRALLIAGCGSGKTLAAWNWARAQLAEYELAHVIFLYPTRGTATEGFRDYVACAPESDAALVHGTAGYELEGMQANPSEAMRGKSFSAHDDEAESSARLFALRLWSPRYFSATVDQFLAFLEHRYESVCSIPVMAESAVILDEVHSYDRTMFENLIAFLTHFSGPVLCMTATLPLGRRRQLEGAGLRVYPEAADRVELADLEAAECHPRYRVARVADADDAFGRALAAYTERGKRVLWVVNTVARCQELARRLGQAAGLGGPALAYHSRYRFCDRRTKHAATVAAFQQRGRPALAVTTQVCEMSLDLDADVLITELAPIPSLVQRMGRANRHARPDTPERAEVYVYEPESILPYTAEDLDAARRFLDHFLASPGASSSASGGARAVELSQRRLADALECFSPREPKVRDSARFTESGYFAVPGSFRDSDDFGARCVLDSDVPALDALRRDPDRGAFERALPGYELSVPRRQILDPAGKPSWLPRYLELAPGRHYHPDLGFAPEDPDRGEPA